MFQDWIDYHGVTFSTEIDYHGVTFSTELLEWNRTFSDFWGRTVLIFTVIANVPECLQHR